LIGFGAASGDKPPRSVLAAGNPGRESEVTAKKRWLQQHIFKAGLAGASLFNNIERLL